MTAINYRKLHVRLAESNEERRAAQKLRYDVFYREMGAKADKLTTMTEMDQDAFDNDCDHLLVIDPERLRGDHRIVGTYRMMRRSIALKAKGFYSAQEYDLSSIIEYPGEIVELGRSCVHPLYRSRGTLQLLWRGIADYIDAFDISMMFGCASMQGTDPEAIALQLSYLYHYHLAPKDRRPRALDHRYVDMNKMAKGDIDVKKALLALPPLLKGYLRVGGIIGDGAVVDEQFNTTDVCIMAPTNAITEKYNKHYGLSTTGAPQSRQSAPVAHPLTP